MSNEWRLFTHCSLLVAHCYNKQMRRILALDGGGIRGIFTLQVLAQIEKIFREETGRPDPVLRDSFDFFAGTSTGAIIATCLAWGMSVAEIEALYINRAAEMIAREAWYRRWKARYRSESIASFFREAFCEEDHSPALLGTRKFYDEDRLKYLLVVMRNATTGSPWPISNNPRAKYNAPENVENNLNIPLWKLLRASTAAPTFFPPESIQVGAHRHLFVDGGVTPYNNPALIAFLMATLPAYRMEWETGPDRLQLVSVGTGSVRTVLAKQQAERIHLIDQLQFVVPSLLESVALEQDLVCRILGTCHFGGEIDSEIGDLQENAFTRNQKLFSYVRYNRYFRHDETSELLKATKQQFSLDNLGLIPFLQRAGREYAAANVQRQHFFP